jgi:ABC-type polysaccharide/polyol phosphate export permease
VKPEPGRHSLADGPLVQLTLVRFREFWREPEAVFWVFVFPILLAAGLGIAFRSRPADATPVGVVGSAPGAERVAAALRTEPALRVELLPDSAVALAVPTGKVALVVVPQANGSLVYRYDDTRPEGRTARRAADAALQRAAGRRDPVAAADELVREPGSRYIDFVLPGLLGLNLMGGGIWSIGFAIVEARRRKLLKRFVATPMSRTDYLLSFLLARLVMLVLEVAAVVLFGLFVFGVPLRGSVAQLALVCVVAALSFSALGLLISSRARTIEGASGLMNLAMLPMWVFSGVFFSTANFPASLQPFIQALPLTAVNDALRATMLQGAGLGAVAGEIGILAAWLIVSFVLALRLFRWQ